MDEALAAVGMSEHGRPAGASPEFRPEKRVCIAGVLAMQPEVLLLDEPMAGLDAAMQVELQALLDGWPRGITVVLATHDVDFAYRWADDIHLLPRPLPGLVCRRRSRRSTALFGTAGRLLLAGRTPRRWPATGWRQHATAQPARLLAHLPATPHDFWLFSCSP